MPAVVSSAPFVDRVLTAESGRICLHLGLLLVGRFGGIFAFFDNENRPGADSAAAKQNQ